MNLDDAELAIILAFNAKRVDGELHIATWNADCDKADVHGMDPFRNDRGEVCFFRCTKCGAKYVDPDEGRRHEAFECTS